MGIELSKLCIANWLRREKKRVLLRRWFLSGSLINGVELDASTGLHLRPRALAPGRRRFLPVGQGLTAIRPPDPNVSGSTETAKGVR